MKKDFKATLRDCLSRHSKRRLQTSGMTESAVLVPLYQRNGEATLLLTRRGVNVRDHKREISFPGGVCEKGDRDLRQTAVRESVEELGIDPETVEILGELDDESTFRTGYRITPFLAWLDWPCPLKVNEREIDEILEVPLDQLRKPSHVEFRSDDQGRQFRIPFYQFGPHTIWGATGRIIEGLTTLLGPVII